MCARGSHLCAKPPVREFAALESSGWQLSSSLQACSGTHLPTSAGIALVLIPPVLFGLADFHCSPQSCRTGVVTVRAALELKRVGVSVPRLPGHNCSTHCYKYVPVAGDAGPEASLLALGCAQRKTALPALGTEESNVQTWQ